MGSFREPDSFSCGHTELSDIVCTLIRYVTLHLRDRRGAALFRSRNRAEITIREFKHRVYVKRQTANANLYYVTKFPLYLSFTVHYLYALISSFHANFLSVRIVVSRFICSFSFLLNSHFD